MFTQEPAAPVREGLRIEDLLPGDEAAVRRAAELLVEGFRAHWPEAWPTLEDALGEVREAFTPGRIARVARGAGGEVLGWVGAQPQYDGRVWELHPLVVDASRRMRGVGRALVEDLVACVRERGALTLWLGTDDEDRSTTLGGADLYEDLPRRLAEARGSGDHPLEFYRRLGFTTVGVMPDANGPGKPDIFLARSLR